MERPRWAPPALFPSPQQQNHHQQQQFALQSNQRFALLDNLIAQQKRGIPQLQQRFAQPPAPIIASHNLSSMGASHHQPPFPQVPAHLRPPLNGAPSHRPPRPNHLNQFLRHPSFNPPSPTQQRPVLRPRCLPAWFQQKPLAASQLSKPEESCSPMTSQTKRAPNLQQAPSVKPNQTAIPALIPKPDQSSMVTESSPAAPVAAESSLSAPSPGSLGPSVPQRSLQDRLQLLTEPFPLQPPPASCPFDIPLPSSPAPKKSIPLDDLPQSSTSKEPQTSPGEGCNHVKETLLPKLEAETVVTKVLFPTLSDSTCHIISFPNLTTCSSGSEFKTA